MSSTEQQNLFTYILEQSESILTELLNDPDTCRIFVRLLNPLAQHYLYRMMLLGIPLLISQIKKWGNKDKTQQTGSAINQLLKCKILLETQNRRGDTLLIVNPDIVRVLKEEPQTYDVPISEPTIITKSIAIESRSSIFKKPEPKKEFDPSYVPYVTSEVLDEWAKSRLDRILSWMLGIIDDVEPEIRQLLADAKLQNFEGQLINDGNLFVLLNKRDQIWRIIKSCLENEGDAISPLKFLLKLGSLQFTRGYPLVTLSDSERSLCERFSIIGLVYIEDGYYFCTRSILNFFGKSELFYTKGWMLIDNNFKITAYTSNPLNIELLRQFARVTYMMPGFTSAFISPDSFKEALQKGVQFHNIVAFLKANLLPEIGGGTIPPNVEHQFEVWERQRDRIKVFSNCVLRKYYDLNTANAAAELADMGLIFFYRKDNYQYFVITSHDHEAKYSQALKEMMSSR